MKIGCSLVHTVKQDTYSKINELADQAAYKGRQGCTIVTQLLINYNTWFVTINNTLITQENLSTLTYRYSISHLQENTH